jgi:hypothetical protein
MINPIPSGNAGSYNEMKGRIFRKLISAGLAKQIIILIQSEVDATLASGNIVLSRSEQKHLLVDTSSQMFDEIIKNLKE